MFSMISSPSEANLRTAELFVLKTLQYRISGPTVLTSFVDIVYEITNMSRLPPMSTELTTMLLRVTKDILFSMDAMDQSLRMIETKRAATNFALLLKPSE